MALFLGIHNMSGPTEDEAITGNWEKYKAACKDLGCSPVRAYSSGGAGKAFCVTEAESADMVQKAHDQANVPINEIIEVKELQ
jgi:hypothetical protein